MTKKSSLVTHLTLGLSTALLLTLGHAQAASYTISTLEHPDYPQASITLKDINSNGEIIGSISTSSSDFKWSAQNGFLFYDSISGTTGAKIANELNELGDVGGRSVSAPQFQATVIWPNDNTQIHIGMAGLITDINESGQAVGSCYQCYAQLWNYHTGESFDLITPSGKNLVTHAINNHGLIAAHVLNSQSVVETYTYDFDTQVLTQLFPPIIDSNQAALVEINDNNQIILNGAPTSASNCTNNCGVLYSGGNWQVLPSLVAIKSNRAFDMNESGTVVGQAYNAQNKLRATIWTHGQISDLNDQIDPTSGWELSSAKGISNDGKIVGYGKLNGITKPFILTPEQASCDPVDNGNGTISDPSTGLMWIQDSEAMGFASWNGAKAEADTLTTAGHTDWRLPEIAEFEALYTTLTRSGTFQPVPFVNLEINGRDDWHWSNTQASDICWWWCRPRAWVFDFEAGAPTEVIASYGLSSLPVRTETTASCSH